MHILPLCFLLSLLMAPLHLSTQVSIWVLFLTYKHLLGNLTPATIKASLSVASASFEPPNTLIFYFFLYVNSKLVSDKSLKCNYIILIVKYREHLLYWASEVGGIIFSHKKNLGNKPNDTCLWEFRNVSPHPCRHEPPWYHGEGQYSISSVTLGLF